MPSILHDTEKIFNDASKKMEEVGLGKLRHFSLEELRCGVTLMCEDPEILLELVGNEYKNSIVVYRGHFWHYGGGHLYFSRKRTSNAFSYLETKKSQYLDGTISHLQGLSCVGSLHTHESFTHQRHKSWQECFSPQDVKTAEILRELLDRKSKFGVSNNIVNVVYCITSDNFYAIDSQRKPVEIILYE